MNRVEAAVTEPQQIEIDTIAEHGDRILRVSGAITHLTISGGHLAVSNTFLAPRLCPLRE